MKWKIAVPVLALAGFLAGAPAHAIGGGIVFGVQGGGGIPTGDYGDEFSRPHITATRVAPRKPRVRAVIAATATTWSGSAA